MFWISCKRKNQSKDWIKSFFHLGTTWLSPCTLISKSTTRQYQSFVSIPYVEKVVCVQRLKEKSTTMLLFDCCSMFNAALFDVGMMSQCIIVGIHVPCRHTGNIARFLNCYRSIRQVLICWSVLLPWPNYF